MTRIRNGLLLCMAALMFLWPPRAALAQAAAWPDWGEAPSFDDHLPEVRPALPAAAGWARYLGADQSLRWELLACNADLAFVETPAGIAAYALSDGSVAWERRLAAGDEWWFGPQEAIERDGVLLFHLYVETVPVIHAYSADSGSELWKKPGMELLACGSGGVWAVERDAQDQSGALQLLDTRSGEQRQRFTGSFANPAVQSGRLGAYFATASRSRVHVVGPAGHVLELPRQHPDAEPHIALDDDGLLLAEHAASRTQPDGVEQPGETTLSYFDLPGGELRWSLTLPDPAPDNIYPRDFLVNLSARTAAYASNARCWLLDRQNGELRLELTGGPSIMYCHTMGNGLLGFGFSLYTASGERLETPRLLHMDSLRWLDLPRELMEDALASPDGWLLAKVSQYGTGADLPENTALACFRLDGSAEGPALLPGALDWVSAPERFERLGEDFLASAAPLEDAGLMRRAVAAGGRGLNRLLELCGPDDRAQLDALAVLADYLDRQPGMQHRQLRNGSTLRHHLRRMGEAAVPAVITWLEDPRLTRLHPRLRATLAETGGPAARDYLRCHDLDWGSTPLEAVSSPQRIERPAPRLRRSYVSRVEGAKYDQNQWAEALAADGTRYCAFTHDRTAHERQIYLGIDSGNDGTFDEILPTALRDAGAWRQGDLELRLDLPAAVEIAYDHILEAGQGGSGEPVDAIQRVVTRVELALLRLDCDGDGLTDLAERLLLTDPWSADSDGDGMSDLADPAPLADHTAMGPAERTVARALDFYYRDQLDWERRGLPGGNPPYITYFSVLGCGPVALTVPAGQSVCISHPAHASRLKAQGFGDPWLGRVTLHAPLANAELGTRPSGEELLGFVDYGREHAAQYSLSLDFDMQGYSIGLVEIDGEYYPVDCRLSWVS